jgi:arginine-tRNA-protein transferase
MSHHIPETEQFYLTEPGPCPYLEGESERKVFTHLVGPRAEAAHEQLARAGFRRSQHIAYRPACQSCNACTATRVLTDCFTPTRSQRRVLKKNVDLIGNEVENVATGEQFSLFRRYLEARHGEGGMLDMTVLDYAMMVEDSSVETNLIEFRRRDVDSSITGRGSGDLIAVSLFDRMRDGHSLVYSFFEPDLATRSLGTFIILDHIARARREGLPFCHLGFYVAGSQKMAYKAAFNPQQRLTSGGWVKAEASG